MLALMPNYRRVWIQGGTYFFTVAIADRTSNILTARIDDLRGAFRRAHHARPFTLDAIVVLPDHIHAVWTLPSGDADYATRWSHIKAEFSRASPAREPAGASRARKRERGIWQRRYWARAIVDERDLAAHIDYVHINPVKHGHAARAADWPWSSFHRFVRDGRLAEDWAAPLDRADFNSTTKGEQPGKRMMRRS
jgi:putative transposase